MTSPRPVLWTARALDDLDLIHAQIAAERPMVAERMKRRLVEAADMLESFPEVGRAQGDTRILVTVRPYVMRYRVNPEAVVILGVRHGARRP
jgi:plasmid stabilization system protein ParE